MVIILCGSEKVCTLIKSLKRNLQRESPTNIQTWIVYTGNKLSSQLKNVKDPTSYQEQHDFVIAPLVLLLW